MRQNVRFYQHLQPIHIDMKKEIYILGFVQGVNFQFMDSLKNKGTKYLVISDDSREETNISKPFVDIATAGRLRGLSTTYIKHNLFYQSKPGRDVELQNTHIVFYKSPRYVMHSSVSNQS